MNDFDSFFVGDGSEKLMSMVDKVVSPSIKPRFNPMDGFDVDKSINNSKFEVIDDIMEFAEHKVDISSIKDAEELFFNSKKTVFDMFNFMSIKSSNMRGMAVKEIDIVLDDMDHHIIEYMIGYTKDSFAFKSVAVLMAYENMKIGNAIFVESDGCSLCNSIHGSIISVGKIRSDLVAGGFISHPYCECDFFPVIDRGSYNGPISGSLNIDCMYLGNKEVHNFPTEFNCEGFKKLISKLSYDKINFINIFEMFGNVGTNNEDIPVVHYDDDDEILYIHNGYISNYSPIDYLIGYINNANSPHKIDVSRLSDRYYLNGMVVVKHDGKYWNANTGELVR